MEYGVGSGLEEGGLVDGMELGKLDEVRRKAGWVRWVGEERSTVG